MLGFKEYWLVPETNTPEVANAVGMDSYRVKGSLMSLNDAENRTVIDLLQWVTPEITHSHTQIFINPALHA